VRFGRERRSCYDPNPVEFTAAANLQTIVEGLQNLRITDDVIEDEEAAMSNVWQPFLDL
jgi:hypothetical protein